MRRKFKSAALGSTRWENHSAASFPTEVLAVTPKIPPAERPVGAPAPGGTVAFRLRAPHDPGTYPATAVLLDGTENTDRAGFFQRPSGRTLFSTAASVAVR